MVVADNEVYPFRFGVSDLFHSLDAAVENDNQLHPRLKRIVYSLLRHTIPFVVAVRDVVVEVRIVLLQKTIDQRNRRTPVHIIVTIDQDAFLPAHRLIQTLHSQVHIPHQERIVEVVQLGSEELTRLVFGGDAPLNQKPTQNRAEIQGRSQLLSLLCFLRC